MKSYKIKNSDIDKKGRGLYATKDIKEGTKIINYKGKLITKKQTAESEKYLNAYEHVLKKLKEFKPEFLLFSAGFDAHMDDPLAQLRLESEDLSLIHI